MARLRTPAGHSYGGLVLKPGDPTGPARTPRPRGPRGVARPARLLMAGLVAWAMAAGLSASAPAGAGGASAAEPGPVDLKFDTVMLGAAHAANDSARTTGGGARAQASIPARSVNGIALVKGTQMVGFSWAGSPTGSIEIRTRSAGTWTPWTSLDGDESDGPDVSTGRVGTGPVWLGGDEADRVEVRVGAQALADFEVLRLRWDESAVAAPSSTRAASTRAAQPLVRPRSTWAPGGWRGDLPGCTATPYYLPEISMAVVHHTVSGNTYSAAQVPGILAGIYRYHTESLRWCDIAYNFVVDRFGGIWQGRSGDIGRNVMGGHTKGFNSVSVGVALLGQYQPGASPAVARPANAQISSLERLLAWKLGREAIDPLGTVRVRSSGSNKYPAGTRVTLPTVSVHRDTAYTSCPGDYVRARMTEIRWVTRSLMPTPKPEAGAAPFRTRRALIERQAVDLYERNATLEDLWVGLSWFNDGRTGGEVASGMTDAPDVATKTDPVVRLYYSAFGRAPDTSGFTSWRLRSHGGMSIRTIAASFAATAEFSTRYPEGTDAEYVTALYRNVLGRVGDPGWHARHEASLASGAETRASLLVRFSETAENVRNTQATVQTIATYHAMLLRVPSPSSLANWSARPLARLTTAILASSEYVNRFR